MSTFQVSRKQSPLTKPLSFMVAMLLVLPDLAFFTFTKHSTALFAFLHWPG